MTIHEAYLTRSGITTQYSLPQQNCSWIVGSALNRLQQGAASHEPAGGTQIYPKQDGEEPPLNVCIASIKRFQPSIEISIRTGMLRHCEGQVLRDVSNISLKSVSRVAES